MFQFICIGKVLKPYQNNGEFLCVIQPEYFEDMNNCKAIFLKVDGLEIPFFIENMELDKATSILKLEEFNAPESVKPYNGQEIYLRTEDVKNGPHTDQNTEKLHGLEGFILVDLNTDLKAEIVAIEEFPQQLMATVVVEGNEYFVPLVEELIEEINAENKTISMHLPEGLFEA